MKDLNTITLSGRLTSDADVKNFNDNTVFNFSLAFNTTKKTNNEWVEQSNFIQVSFWSKASFFNDTLKKGRKIVVIGEIIMQTYTNKDHVEVKQIKLNAREITIFPSKDDAQVPEKNVKSTISSDFDDDIPF